MKAKTSSLFMVGFTDPLRLLGIRRCTRRRRRSSLLSLIGRLHPHRFLFAVLALGRLVPFGWGTVRLFRARCRRVGGLDTSSFLEARLWIVQSQPAVL